MTRIILLALAMALSGACVVHLPASWSGHSSSEFTIDGQDIHYDDGVFEVDGVVLPYDRWVALSGTLEAVELRLATATGAIDIEASEDRSYALDVHLYSELEGDGEVLFENGRLKAVSDGGHKLLVNGVRGRAPNGLHVRLESGTGHVVVAGFSGGRMDIDCGMGDVTASALSSSNVSISAGMGAVELTDSQGERLDAENGMGSVTLDGAGYDVIVLEAGMGGVVVRRSEARQLDAELGMGGLLLADTRVTHLSADLGMGDVVFEGDTPPPETLNLDTGLGRVIHR